LLPQLGTWKNRSIHNFGKWCTINELQVGIRKCAAMGISGTTDINEAHDLLKQAKHTLIIGTDSNQNSMLIPVLDEYKYLGTFFHYSFSRQLSLQKHANVKTCPSIYGIAPFLRNQNVPIKLRTQMMLQFLRPSLTHANVIWAMRAENDTTPFVISTQKFLSIGLAYILGKTIRFKTDNVLHEQNVALLELDILDVEAYAAQEKIATLHG
jgi:hypothetical protein